MTELVGYLVLFLAVGFGFIFVHLLAGKLIRPAKPDPEKLTIYECGEPTIGSAWVQFDLRFYVVALLFVIFDVEIAFFFPWAVVFGTATKLGDESVPEPQRVELVHKFDPTATRAPTPAAAQDFAEFAFLELLAFFGILLVGFAYLWRRGDLEWVRSVAGQSPAVTASGLTEVQNAAA